MDDIFIKQTEWKDMFAIKVNNKDWFPDYRNGKKEHNLVLTVNTRAKARKEMQFISNIYPELDLKIVAVEEEIFLDSEKCIINQTLREL